MTYLLRLGRKNSELTAEPTTTISTESYIGSNGSIEWIFSKWSEFPRKCVLCYCTAMHSFIASLSCSVRSFAHGFLTLSKFFIWFHVSLSHAYHYLWPHEENSKDVEKGCETRSLRFFAVSGKYWNPEIQNKFPDTTGRTWQCPQCHGWPGWQFRRSEVACDGQPRSWRKGRSRQRPR